MALPSDLYSLSVTGSLKDATGVALAGTISFTLSATLTDSTGNVVIPAYPKPYQLSGGALLTAPLVSNDSPDLLPTGSTYLVTVALQNMQQYSYYVQLLAAPLSFTATSATPCVFTAAGSSYANGTAVTLTGGSLPAGFTAATTYYVVSASGTSFSLAATSGGSAIASTGTGSGTVSTASVDLADLQPVVPQGTPVSYVPTSGGTYTGTVVLDGSPALQIPAGATAGQVLTSDASGNGVWAAPALVVKPEVQEATAAALPANAYASGVLTASSNGALTVDGIAVTAGDRILVKNEVTAANNGVYVATSAGASGAKYVLTRSADMSIAADIPGAFIFVQQGTNNGNTGWMVTGAGPWTLGSTAIAWAQFSAVPAIGLLTPTATKTANYTAVSGDMVKTDTSGGSFTVTLPSAPPVNTTIGVKQIAVAGLGTNATTITCGGSDVFNKSGGPTSMTLDRLNQTVIMQYGTGGIWTVQATDPATGQIATARNGVYYLDTFTGTDDAKMASALTAVFAASPAGGTIVLSPRTHTFANQWTTSFSSGVYTSLRILGAGASPNGTLQASGSGATQVTFTYSGGGNGDMDFRHLGLLEISGIDFTDTVNAVPWLYSTYPVLNIHDNSFLGVGSGATCTKDAFILGSPAGTAGQIFQGYGSRIYGNHFDSTRVVAWFNPSANAVQVFDNTISTTCGNPTNFGAPFILNGNSANPVEANQIHHNLIEMVHYQSAVYAQAWGTGNLIGPNGLFDNNAVTNFAVGDTHSTHNSVNDLIYAGQTPSNPPFDPTVTTTNMSQNNQSMFVQSQLYFASVVGSAFYGESIFGGQGGIEGSGPNVSGWPSAAVIVTNNPTEVTDAATISGTPYVTSATAAFTLAGDVGHQGATLTTAVPGGARIVWAWTHSSFGIAWQASTAVALGAPGLPTSQNGHLYQATTAGTTGSSQPTWPTAGGTVTDGSVVWQDLGTSVTMAQMSMNSTASTTGNSFYFGRATGNKQLTSFRNHHVNGSGGACTWTATGAGSGYTATSVGNDLGHIFTLVTGTGSTAGIVATGATSNSLYQTAGTFSITANNANAAALMTAAAGAPWIVISGQGGWVMTIPGTPADGTTYKFCIIMIG